ncbi:hypothetical protein PS663_00847 [Pseudomonas fluorescens]|nr:hypothetical protein PS663_00847 [Pseudomonas fluorescens]
MSIENVMLTVSRVPDIVMKAETDWVVLGGIFITALVVLSGTIITVFQFSKTIKSQEAMAKNNSELLRAQSRSENLAKSRQEWINSLRAEVASFLSVIHEVYTLSDEIKDPKIRGGTESEIFNSWDKHYVKADKFYSFLARGRFHLANVKMHLNPLEADAQILERSMELLIGAAYSHQNIYDGTIDVTDITRRILKSEWERVKQMV